VIRPAGIAKESNKGSGINLAEIAFEMTTKTEKAAVIVPGEIIRKFYQVSKEKSSAPNIPLLYDSREYLVQQE
jgi:hypothetical protein